jgi:hypothetical protein
MFNRNTRRGGNPNIAKRGGGFRDDGRNLQEDLTRVCPDGSSPDPVYGCQSPNEKFRGMCPDGSMPGPNGICEGGRGMRKGGTAKSKMADKAGRAMKKRTPDKMGRAMVKKMAGGGMAYSGGGSVYRKGADGVATKGKTKGKMVKMMKGGYCG